MDEQKIKLTVMITPAEHHALKRISRANHRTMSDTIRHWIERDYNLLMAPLDNSWQGDKHEEK